MPLIVHHLENSRSQRVLWALEELRLEYEIRRYARDKATMLAPPELKAVHRLGKSPVLEDGDQVLAESGAILEYLVETYGKGKFVPKPGTPDAQRYRYWMHYAEGSLMPPLLMKLVFNRIRNAPMPFFAKPIARAIVDKTVGGYVQPQITLHLDWIEEELGRSEWFAGGTFTAADIQMSFPVEAATSRGGLDKSRPNTMAWLDRIHARPAYAKALERGGPFELLR